MLCYNICWSILVSYFLSGFCPIPTLYNEIPAFYDNIFLFVFQFSGNIRGWVPIDFLWSIENDRVIAMAEVIARMKAMGTK